MEEEEHQKPTSTVPVDVLDLEKSKNLAPPLPDPEPDNAVGERGEDLGADDQEVIPSSLVFACEFCPKVFSSGKALGGHKRIHSQAKREPRKNNGKRKQSTVIAGSSLQVMAKNEREPITTCPICKSEFLSEKAMSGHLKVHKDRPWKGLQPPKRYAGASPSPSPSPSPSSVMDEDSSELNYGDRMDDEPVDIEERTVLITWRAGENPNSSSGGTNLHLEDENGREDGEAEELAEFANVLMSLRHGDRRGASTCSNRAAPEDSEPQNRLPENMEIDSGSETRSNRAVPELDKITEKRRKLGYSDVGGEDADVGDNKIGMRVYNCGTCDRVFTSHQAYGGHLSSHKKIEKTTSSPQQTLGSAADDQALQESGAAPVSPSGEAMEEPKSCGITGKRAVHEARPRCVVDFDLNYPAPDMDREEEE